MAKGRGPVHVLIDEILNEILFDLVCIEAVEKIFYETGVNPHPRILEKVYKLGGRLLNVFHSRK